MTQKQYALAGLLAPVIFWAAYFSLASIRPDYSFLTKAVSELGSLDAPNKWLWNISGYILPGMLIMLYAVGLHSSVTGGMGSKVPLYSIALSGFFMTLSGIFPGDFENRQSLTMLVHSVGSFGSYLCFLVAAFSYPKLMRRSRYWKAAVKPTLTFVFLTILFGAWPFVFPEMPAVGQRLVFFFYFLWIAYTATKVYRQATHAQQPF